jgi:hypothetical protein
MNLSIDVIIDTTSDVTSLDELTKIIVVELTKIIFNHVMFKYDASQNVVSNREFVFINVYWTNIYYHIKIKRRLNIFFYSQTNE